MNETINKFLLTGDRFIPELRLRHPGFTYSACGTFTWNCQRIQNFKETSALKDIYVNDLSKAGFDHDPAHAISKDLAKRIVSDKILKAYEVINL